MSELNWRLAPCHDHPSWWEEGIDLPDDRRETDRARRARHRRAIAGCRRCSLLDACRAVLAEQSTPSGVWAGKLFLHGAETVLPEDEDADASSPREPAAILETLFASLTAAFAPPTGAENERPSRPQDN